ncbi:hypothetical protein NY78_1961 [Desulfovibrio sp. TomC]|nr:hypothetical protein NY78_1961 [Desulfovibrio sp. TomC]
MQKNAFIQPRRAWQEKNCLARNFFRALNRGRLKPAAF